MRIKFIKNEVKGGFIFNKLILGSEGDNENNNEHNNSQEEENIFGLDKVMNILFNEEGNLRNKIGYNIKKI